MTVVMSFTRPLDVGWLGESDSRVRLWGLASGLHTKPAEIFQQGEQFGIQIDLTPAGARKLLGLPMGALARELVALDDLLPAWAAGWHEHIAGQPTWARRFEALDRLLLKLAAAGADQQGSRVRPELAWAWSRIDSTGGRERVSSLADKLGWSRRHLHQQFHSEYGIAPKQAVRIVRFQRSLTLFGAQGHALGEVAGRCGYADQAHLTREWRSLAGYSPWQWKRMEFPFLQDDGQAGLPESTHE
jgi:AraC-like DNA-binding protein